MKHITVQKNGADIIFFLTFEGPNHERSYQAKKNLFSGKCPPVAGRKLSIKKTKIFSLSDQINQAGGHIIKKHRYEQPGILILQTLRKARVGA